jgi:hypothetical protein
LFVTVLNAAEEYLAAEPARDVFENGGGADRPSASFAVRLQKSSGCDWRPRSIIQETIVGSIWEKEINIAGSGLLSQ